MEDLLACIITRIDKKKTKNGDDYLDLELRDIDGNTFNAKKWQANEAEVALQIGGIIAISGKEEEWNNFKYINIKDFTIDDTGAIGAEEFLVTLPDDVQQKNQDKFQQFCNSITDKDYKDLLKVVFSEKVLEKFFKWPAASKYHDSEIGGLLAHTIKVCEVAVGIYNGTKDFQDLDYDLIIVAGLIHDIGKIDTYGLDKGGPRLKNQEYLVGHTVYSLEKVAFAEKMLGKDFHKVKHLICAHQGQKDYDAVKVPHMKEAFLLYYSDIVAAHFVMMDQLDYDDDLGKAWSPTLKRYIFKNTAQDNPECP